MLRNNINIKVGKKYILPKRVLYFLQIYFKLATDDTV